MNCERCGDNIPDGLRFCGHCECDERNTARRSFAAPHGYDAALTEGQRVLKAKHGTPAEFAVAVYTTVPHYLSMTEAADAVRKYSKEWSAAS